MGGTRELRKIFFEIIPVKQVSDEINDIFEKMITTVQSLKSQQLPTLNIEKEIDEILFDLYNLTTEEKEAIGFIEIQ